MRTLTYIAAITALLAFSIILARYYPEKAFVGFGLLLTIFGSATSLVCALVGARRAKLAQHLTPEDFLPAETPPSYSFKDESEIMGRETVNLNSLNSRIEGLNNRLTTFQSLTEKKIQFIDRRCDINLAIVRHHKEVLVPKAIASTATFAYLSSWLTMLGAVILAFPDSSREIVLQISNSASYIIAEALHSIAS